MHPDAQSAVPPTNDDKVDTSDFGDPLGVTTRASASHASNANAREKGRGLDFAGFAAHGAFRE